MPADENTNPAASRVSRAPDPSRYQQGPRGTRDFYPLEMAKRRWIEQRWRKVATRFGFEEIDGPRFEHLDTYTVKSGEGIVSELFSFTRAGGETEFALRPEFTPTLARMAAAKANALPKPIKWFSVGPYFRAERPQRGRLREFLQWNVDMLGNPSPQADAEVIACCVEMLRECGLTEKDVKVKTYDRTAFHNHLLRNGASEQQILPALVLVDQLQKLSPNEVETKAIAIGLPEPVVVTLREQAKVLRGEDSHIQTLTGRPMMDPTPHFAALSSALKQHGVAEWCWEDPFTVRGLAYYTGTVFEVHEATGAERAIAGGGRYDNLVELFGGPSTPAVGFAMGDVVLALVLQDKGLMPSDAEIAAELKLDPDVFVFAVDESLDAHAAGFLARCRREGMHARKSYKTTRNVGKLLKEAANQRARVAVFLEPSNEGASFRYQVKDLRGDVEQEGAPSDERAMELLHRILKEQNRP